MKANKFKTMEVKVDKIKPPPNALDFQLFDDSQTIILNADMTLIGGQKLFEQARKQRQEKVLAAVPDRNFSIAEFEFFLKLYTMAYSKEVVNKQVSTRPKLHRASGKPIRP